MEIATKYDPKECEERWYVRWEETGAFTARPESGKPPYTIVIPPPNVTGVLHSGHAMFVTLQDILIRWRRMQGYDALWLPGTDHAGIATQMVVSKELEKQGLSRSGLGREKFLEKVWEWRREKGDAILLQLRKLGASCDWTRTRFTLDKPLSHAVRTAFVKLYQEGLIYRGHYMINWCPSCGTALSDLEAEHEEKQGNLWHILYRLEGGAPGEGLTVATTRPETLLGDSAVAVHPEDERYRGWIGKRVLVPVVNRSVPVIADAMVDRAFGTGAVKITPAHDPNDFEAGKRHNLEAIAVIGHDGRMTSNAGPYAGQDRFTARKGIIKQLEAEGLMVKVEPHLSAVSHCQRCHTVVEPVISNQWFLRIAPLAGPAIKAVEQGEIRIIPDHWRKVYLNWMSDIHDWCISRQLWWGHRIPAWYCESCGKGAGGEDPQRKMVSMEDLDSCPYCGKAVRRDPDVLDTWFSSQLWPFSTLGWPEKTADFERYYPTAVMETGYDILFFWVARMIMAGLKFTGKPPFKEVFLHGLVRDAKGRKMSKTLGNVVDPLELIELYGADAVRFTLAILCVPGTDVALDTKRMEGYRAFANKLWNASRYVMMQAGDAQPSAPAGETLGPWDRWILSEFEKTARGVNSALEAFRFYEAADLLYHFTWHSFCDWYLEASKPAIQSGGERAGAARWTLVHVLDGTLRLLHPIMPFITEELWQRISPREGFIAHADYPAGNEGDYAAPSQLPSVMELVNKMRNVRAERGLSPSAPLEAVVVPQGPGLAQALDESRGEVMFLARLSSLVQSEALPDEQSWTKGVVGGFRFALRAAASQAVDAGRERQRLEAELKKALAERDKFAAKLANPSFSERAPAEVVEKSRTLMAEYARKADDIRSAIESLLDQH